MAGRFRVVEASGTIDVIEKHPVVTSSGDRGMLQFTSEGSGTPLCDGISRRTWLEIGTLGTIGLSLPQWWGAQARGDDPPTSGLKRERKPAGAKACIQIYLSGGPGQHETWDLKPDAPSGIRGEFRPIETSLAGFQICEHLPRMAQRAHQYATLRSVTHTGVNHSTSVYHMLTGHIHPFPGSLRHPVRSDMPGVGCNAGRFLNHPAYLPAYVSLPAIVVEEDGLPIPGQDAGILGENHAPFRVLGDLTRPDFRVPALELAQGLSRDRLNRRVDLREAIDRQVEYLAQEQSGRAVDSSYERAVSLLASSKTEEAFNLSREPAALRERYGNHHFAQALLLARRLVEHGVPFVTVYWTARFQSDNQHWDTHFNQHARMRQHLLPQFDQAVSAFLDDMTDRGLLDETLVTWWGEFGRTPKINPGGGRDHWGFCQSVGMTGGGIKRGLVYGSSTKDGGYPDTCPVTPDDLTATMFHCLGIDHSQHMHDQQGRPVRLSFGEPVSAVLT
jgi:hypothetical protein